MVHYSGRFCCLVIGVLFCLSTIEVPASDRSAEWPEQKRTTRPWAYWWWMGSAVDKENISRELQRYHDAGYGGVHIIPIYGANGWEDKYIPYLSPKWMEMLDYTVTEARKLDLGIDMTTGTGWCFGGGPNVGEREGNASVVLKTIKASSGQPLSEKFNRTNTQAVVAYSTDGESVDLTRKIAADGSISWTAPSDGWQVYVVSQKPSGQKVKRAAPGGEGPMLNLLSINAMNRFLSWFEGAFSQYDGAKPRAQYHDSYEYKNDWSPEFFAQFQKRRGYKLQEHLPAFFAGASRSNASTFQRADESARVLYDYRETVSDIMVEDTLPMWVRWSHRRGFITRNEAHGSPGNLLDLYAVADVPETEMFHTDRSKLVSKFASSAAHTTGKRFVSSETGTWLEEHFTETLADMKFLLDDLFLCGVNNIFYHGTCYSPDEAGWPGWVFYASFEMNPRNSIWRDVPALNAYASRCQSILQSGSPDNDILLYWPIHDFWQKPGGTRLPHMTVHAREWFEEQPIGKAAERLWNRGYAFDYISDRQLADAKVSRTGTIQLPKSSYRVVVVPKCEYLPVETIKKLLSLAKSGATVIFEGELPQDVPGFGNLEKRRAEFKKLTRQLDWKEQGGLRRAKLGRGMFLAGDLDSSLQTAHVRREPMFEKPGLMCIRRLAGDDRYYFIANRGDQRVDEWITLRSPAKSVLVMDALSGRTGVGASRRSGESTEVFLQLAPGESVILRLSAERLNGPAWNYWETSDASSEIKGKWRIDFISGGPRLPIALQTDKLVSWTDLAGQEGQRFAGTARYSITFDAPTNAPTLHRSDASTKYLLDLGKVCQSARVKLNGKDLGTLITPPFQIVADNLAATNNVLEVEVTNVSANRIRDLDRRGVKWKNFRDINFVNINYRPFDASNWPLYDSGLLGPVTLKPLVPAVPMQEAAR